MIVTNDSKTDREVNEATAKLKGLLGIGTAAIAASSEPTAIDRTPTRQQELPPKSAKKKTRTKKKKGKSEENPPNRENQPQKASDEGKGTANKKKKGRKEAENYAWSAFQSSPDASKLPVPEFASPAAETQTVGRITARIEVNTPAAIENSDKIPLQTTTAQMEDVGLDSRSSVKEERLEELPPSPTTSSSTGVNLAAALAAELNAVSDNGQQNLPSTGTLHNPLTTLSGPPPPQMPYQQHNQQHGGFMPPQYPPAPPPGYITIQVQVPPVLMPGRQMIVTSPAGFPVQVVVPDGIPPGMVIPVHVPAGPPLHMMPPTSYGQYYNPGPLHR